MHREEDKDEGKIQYRPQYEPTTMAHHNNSSVTHVTRGGSPSERRPTTPNKTNVRKWLADLFLQSVSAGEQSLENGHLGKAAAMFASATLLTDQSETFTDAVQRVYPCYFYRLYKQRMITMGYGHLFPKTDTCATTRAASAPIRGRSPVSGQFDVRSNGPARRPPSS
ncbi:Uncharacterized protein FWK35_00005566 [Aphis craccivora]|uniref:Uncharacterized protein n=1 Tax=Aphis craccivora TaxID=307492 RepID=A0A6G0YXU0_APHCR|nr:Uncharacterized protein FWK35_00005566 [Aphis craccivora]